MLRDLAARVDVPALTSLSLVAQAMSAIFVGRTADAYARGEIREKQVASRVGCAAQRAEKRGERMRAKIARGVMLLASYLHEGKHTRDASGDALRVFWSHYERVHGEHGKYPLT